MIVKDVFVLLSVYGKEKSILFYLLLIQVNPLLSTVKIHFIDDNYKMRHEGCSAYLSLPLLQRASVHPPNPRGCPRRCYTFGSTKSLKIFLSGLCH